MMREQGPSCHALRPDPALLAARAAYDAPAPEELGGQAASEFRAARLNDGYPLVSCMEDITTPGPGGPIRVRRYAATPAPAGGLLYVHGGGWRSGGLDSHDRVARILACDTGFEVAALAYRLAPSHPYPAALQDVVAVWRAMSGDPTRAARRWAMLGDSAGANLVLAAALNERDAGRRLPDALGLFYGCYAPDLETASARQLGDGRYGLSSARMSEYWADYLGPLRRVPPPQAAPLYARLAGLPPVCIGLAGFDPLADESRLLALALQEAGVRVQLLEWATAVHGLFRFTRDAPLARSSLRAAGLEVRSLALERR